MWRCVLKGARSVNSHIEYLADVFTVQNALCDVIYV